MGINIVTQPIIKNTIKSQITSLPACINRPNFTGVNAGAVKDTFVSATDNGKAGVKETIGNLIQGVKEFITKKDSAGVQTGTEKANVSSAKKEVQSAVKTQAKEETVSDEVVQNEVENIVNGLEEHRANPNREIYQVPASSTTESLGPIPEFVEDSIENCRDHIFLPTLKPKEGGISGGHSKELYERLYDKILNAPEYVSKLLNEQIDRISGKQKNLYNKIIEQLNEKSNLGLDNSQIEPHYISDSLTGFMTKNDKCQSVGVTISDKGKVKAFIDKHCIYQTGKDEQFAKHFKYIQILDNYMKEYTEELTHNPSDTKMFIRHINNSFKNRNKTGITSARVNENGDIILGLNNTRSIDLGSHKSLFDPDTKIKFKYNGCNDLNLILTKRTKNNTHMYRQVFKFNDEQGNVYTRVVLKPKTCKEEKELNEAFNMMIEHQNDRNFNVCKVSDSGFAFKYKDTYYFAAYKQGANQDGAKLCSMYPVDSDFFKSYDCNLADIPDFTNLA